MSGKREYNKIRTTNTLKLLILNVIIKKQVLPKGRDPQIYFSVDFLVFSELGCLLSGASVPE